MNVVEICTIIGTVISLAIILYKIGRITSKVDSNTHRLDKHDSDIKDLNDKLFKYGSSKEDSDLILEITGKAISENDFCNRIIE